MQLIRRRRSCPECGKRFTTVEEAVLAVVKRSGVTEPFSRPKVIAGVRKACQGRPVDDDALALLAQRVEEAVRARAPPRCRATRSAWRSWGRCGSSTRWPTCGSPASTGLRLARRLRARDRGAAGRGRAREQGRADAVEAARPYQLSLHGFSRDWDARWVTAQTRGATAARFREARQARG